MSMRLPWTRGLTEQQVSPGGKLCHGTLIVIVGRVACLIEFGFGERREKENGENIPPRGDCGINRDEVTVSGLWK